MQNFKNFKNISGLATDILMSFNEKTNIQNEVTRIKRDLKVVGYNLISDDNYKITDVMDIDTIETNQTYMLDINGDYKKVFFVNDKVGEEESRYYLIDRKSYNVQLEFECEISALIFILNNRIK